jgi:hypothetical protein
MVALWALHFAGSDHLVNRHVEHTADPILAGRLRLKVFGDSARRGGARDGPGPAC